MPAKPPTFNPRRLAKRDYQRAHDKRRDAEKPWRRWYKLQRWKTLRLIVLARFPSCTRCLPERVTPSTVADHIKPHRGDPALFWDLDNLTGLCATCHNSAKSREDRKAGNDQI